MAAMAGYSQPLGVLPSINAGPSLRHLGATTSPNGKLRKEQAGKAASTKPSASSSPSKKKITVKKARLPEVGPTIKDIENGCVHVTGRLLGQGGFARVYQVQGPDGRPMAFKAVLKEALVNQRKNRQKVLAEILIHRSLSHPNIIKFHDLFQDDANVYFKLELCANGSMNDMVRARGRCLDEEARFYMVQLLAGCQYMHNNHVIHRDLKLGNIMLDSQMNIKIGDFGLAALLKDPEERKKTMCGTPNYIAPEILYQGDGAGHSFEVDVWSVGVILYTLLIGKPPFQTSSVPAIYEKIRNNDYSIPEYIHPAATDLIKRILTPDPSARPTLVQIMHHPWFTCSPIPLSIPSTGTRMVPHLTLPQTEAESRRNLQQVKALSGWRDDADDEVEEEEMSDEQRKQSAKEKRRAQEKAEDEREKMDAEFERAIQPGSSLVAFLRMGRQALVKAPAQTNAPLRTKSSTLARQLSALSISRQHQGQAPMATAGKGYAEDSAAAIEIADKENIHTARMMPPPSVKQRAEMSGAEERRMLGQKARLVAAMSGSGSSGSLNSQVSTGSRRSDAQQEAAPKRAVTTSSMTLMIQYLGEAMDCYQSKMDFVPLDVHGNEVQMACINEPDELNEYRERPHDPSPYIVCWMDEMDKYGLGYALSDGTVGAYLKDDSSIAANPQRSHFDHISKSRSSRSSTTMVQKRETFAVPSVDAKEVSGMSKDVLRKFRVLSYFEDKIGSRLGGFDACRDQVGPVSGLPFVWKWYRCMQAIVFRLSTSVVQFNFYDHTKLFFSQDGLVISAIVPDRSGEAQPMRSWTLAEFFSIADKARSQREQEVRSELALTSHEERRTVRSLLSKIKYARETLIKISTKDVTASSAASSAPIAVATTTTTSGTVRSTRSSARAGSTLSRMGSSASLAPSTLVRSGSGQSIASSASGSNRR